MEAVKRCKVFISSPSDLMKERKLIAEYLKNLKRNDFVFEPIRWESDLPNTSLDKAQELIIEKLLKEADILIGVFSSRFGTATSKADSGTVEEIESFIASGKPVIMYFYNVVLNSTEMDSTLLENLRKINEFKLKYQERHIYSIINNLVDLKNSLERDIDYNVKKLEQNISKANSIKKRKDKSQKKKQLNNHLWFEESIAMLINKEMEKKNIDFKYNGDLTYYENKEFLRGTSMFTTTTEETLLQQARIEAFNKKYGNYDYSQDLRAKYSEWNQAILQRIKNLHPNLNNVEILDVGGNDGSELLQIFKDVQNCKLTVVDLSNEAIKKGATISPNINFHQANMEDDYLIGSSFDICLCLRSIQSRGVFMHAALIQMCKHLKQDGLLIISIPDGYLEDGKIKRGLYDHRTKKFLATKPQDLANKVYHKLIDYGFNEIGIETIKTEIVIWGMRRKEQ